MMQKGIVPKEYYFRKGIIKYHTVIINVKNFYDQPIDSDINWYKEIRKLTTGQGEDYTTECLLNTSKIKLIAIDLSW